MTLTFIKVLVNIHFLFNIIFFIKAKNVIDNVADFTQMKCKERTNKSVNLFKPITEIFNEYENKI